MILREEQVDSDLLVDNMSIVVQKYGGTSVRTASSREIIIENVKTMINKGKQVDWVHHMQPIH